MTYRNITGYIMSKVKWEDNFCSISQCEGLNPIPFCQLEGKLWHLFGLSHSFLLFHNHELDTIHVFKLGNKIQSYGPDNKEVSNKTTKKNGCLSGKDFSWEIREKHR